jgi:hypothetical protein
MCALPQSPASANVPVNLTAPGVFVPVLGTNFMVSSRANIGVVPDAFSGSGTFWMVGHSAIFPAGSNFGSLWLAVDLGVVRGLSGAQFVNEASLSNAMARASSFAVYYAEDIAAWNDLTPRNSPASQLSTYDPSAREAWSLAAAAPTSQMTQITYGGNVSRSFGKLDFEMVRARYVLLCLVLSSGNTGTFNIGDVRFFGSNEPPPEKPVIPGTDSALHPQYGAFSKCAPSSVTTSITYNGNTLTSITRDGGTVPASNYTIGGTASAGTLTFSQSYLNTLPLGTHVFNFRFSGGAIQRFTLIVAEFGSGLRNLTAPPIDPGRVWASTANGARPGIFAFSNENFWALGANTVYPASGTSGIYVTIDLGAEMSVESFSFVLPAAMASAASRLHSVELFGSANPAAWAAIVSRPPNNNTLIDKPNPAFWSLGGSVLAASVTNTVRFNYPDTNGNMTSANWPAATVNLPAPLRARYVMLYLNLRQTATPGTMGLGNLQIFGSDPAAGTIAAISPSFETFDKVAQNTVVTAVSLNGDSFVSAVYNGRTLLKDADYTMTGGAVAAFRLTPGFLNGLGDGRHNITLNFSTSPSQVFGITVTNPLFTDYYLNRPGDGFAVLTPFYPGISLTIGRPALIDAGAQTGKFPVINIVNAKPGTSVRGVLSAPGGAEVYTIPQTPAVTGGSFGIPDSVPLTEGLYKLALTLNNGAETLHDAFYFTAVSDFDKYRSIENIQNSNNSNLANINPDSPGTAEYPAIRVGNDGRLVTAPDFKGNQIIDFSSAGYMGGAAPIPNVPVRRTVSPLSNTNNDAWQVIQGAIDYVSALPLDSNGLRGTVYLEEGVFRISRPLTITASGVVLRGAGPGSVPDNVTGNGTEFNPYDQKIASYAHEPGVTKLIAVWRLTDGPYTPSNDHTSGAGSPYRKVFDSTMINMIGGGSGDYRTGSAATDITDQYAGAGQFQIHVADTSGFEPGDSVHILRMVNADWARAMYMNYIDGANNWVPDGENLALNINPETDTIPPFLMEREIAAIDRAKNLITLAQPLADNLDRRWGVSRMVRIDTDGRLRNVGVENIQGIAYFSNTTSKPALERYGTWMRTYNDENHAHVFVEMAGVRDGWMRNFTTFHLDTAFVTNHGTRNITIQDGNILDPVSLANGGERRYAMYIRKGQFILGQRLYARFTRHAFTLDSTVSGPNVFRDSHSEYLTNASEPHFRWSSGGLFDNVSSRLYIQNRWDMGTSHGHSGVNYLLYNCEGPFMISQPQLAANYQIGHTFTANNRLGSATDPATGRQAFDKRISPNLSALGLNGGMVPNYPAYQYSVTRKVTPALDNMPDSIYLQQLAEAYGDYAVQNTLLSRMPPNISEIFNYGDVNGDGAVNAADTTLLRRYIAHMSGGGSTDSFQAENPGFSPDNADVNGDGVIDTADVALLRKHIAATNPLSVPLGPR